MFITKWDIEIKLDNSHLKTFSTGGKKTHQTLHRGYDNEVCFVEFKLISVKNFFYLYSEKR